MLRLIVAASIAGAALLILCAGCPQLGESAADSLTVEIQGPDQIVQGDVVTLTPVVTPTDSGGLTYEWAVAEGSAELAKNTDGSVTWSATAAGPVSIGLTARDSAGNEATSAYSVDVPSADVLGGAGDIKQYTFKGKVVLNCSPTIRWSSLSQPYPSASVHVDLVDNSGTSQGKQSLALTRVTQSNKLASFTGTFSIKYNCAQGTRYKVRLSSITTTTFKIDSVSQKWGASDYSTGFQWTTGPSTWNGLWKVVDFGTISQSISKR